jgi:hypothetical protein
MNLDKCMITGLAAAEHKLTQFNNRDFTDMHIDFTFKQCPKFYSSTWEPSQPASPTGATRTDN